MVRPSFGLNYNPLVKSLGKRNMGAYFRGEAQRLIGEIEQLPVKSNHDYLSLKQLYEQVYYNADTPKYNISAQVLQSAIENLEMYYCIEKLRYAAESKSRERIFETRFDMPMLEAVIEKTAAPELEAMHPLAFIYNKLICLYIRGIKEEDFREMKLLFIKLFPLLPQEDQQLIIQQLINIGIWLTTKGYEVQPELFSLYKLCIKNKLLLSGNRITSSSFINIVNIAVFVKEFEWAKMFIADFSEYLEIGSQQTVISLISADLFYAQGLLDNAQTSLIPETFMNSEFDIRARWLLLNIIFDRYLLEGKDYEFLCSILNAFEKFATLKKLAKERKNALLNSIRFVRKMVVLKFEMINVPEEKKGQLRKKLVEFQFVVSKKWLSEKIEAL